MDLRVRHATNGRTRRSILQRKRECPCACLHSVRISATRRGLSTKHWLGSVDIRKWKFFGGAVTCKLRPWVARPDRRTISTPRRLVRTSLSPQSLLTACKDIESELGRRRIEHWGPRTIDLDLLLYDDLVLNSPELTIPHPRMTERRFMLEPAAEIANDMLHPTIGRTIGDLLKNLNSTSG